jgi:hypothetical protein
MKKNKCAGEQQFKWELGFLLTVRDRRRQSVIDRRIYLTSQYNEMV